MRHLHFNSMFLGVCIAVSLAVPAQAGYVDVVLADNPHAYWRLGESTGTTAQDATTNNIDGSYVNGPTLSQSGIAGGGGDTAVSFDGTDDKVRIFDSAQPTAYTLETWVKPALLNTQQSMIGRTNSTEQGSHSHELWLRSDNKFYHRTWDGAERWILGTTTAQVDQWYHVVGVYKPGAAGVGFMSLWVNGVREGFWNANTMNNPWAGGDRWMLAEDFPSTGFFNGTLDEVAIYYDVLPDADIQEHYAAGIPEPTTFVLSALGLLGLLGWGRRRRRTKY